jgi:hypothetical protein
MVPVVSKRFPHNGMKVPFHAPKGERVKNRKTTFVALAAAAFASSIFFQNCSGGWRSAQASSSSLTAPASVDDAALQLENAQTQLQQMKTQIPANPTSLQLNEALTFLQLLQQKLLAIDPAPLSQNMQDLRNLLIQQINVVIAAIQDLLNPPANTPPPPTSPSPVPPPPPNTVGQCVYQGGTYAEGQTIKTGTAPFTYTVTCDNSVWTIDLSRSWYAPYETTYPTVRSPQIDACLYIPFFSPEIANDLGCQPLIHTNDNAGNLARQLIPSVSPRHGPAALTVNVDVNSCTTPGAGTTHPTPGSCEAFTIDWGDGSSSSQPVITFDPKTFQGNRLSHVYSKAGSYLVTTTITYYTVRIYTRITNQAVNKAYVRVD